jgi:ABC-type bacteriocin/lantibiotic exporter with double-glycine peptidase domain
VTVLIAKSIVAPLLMARVFRFLARREAIVSARPILNDLGQSVTVVVIAHRLSTVRHADLVVYLEDGSVVAAGSFAEVCARVPAFRRQAELMGLRPA